MKKFISSIFLISAIFSNVIGQTENKPLKQKSLPTGNFVQQIIGTTSDAIYYVGSGLNRMSGLQHYNITKIDKSSLREIWVKKYDINFPSVFISQNKLYSMGAVEKNDKVGVGIYAVEGSNESAEIELMTNIDKNKVRGSIQEKKSLWVYEKLNASTHFSQDSSKILVLAYIRGPKFLKIEDEMYANILDAKTLKLIWNCKIEGAHKGQTIYSFNHKVDNDGNLYYLYTYYNQGDKNNPLVEFAKINSSKEISYFQFQSITPKISKEFYKHLDKKFEYNMINFLGNCPYLEYEIVNNEIFIASIVKNDGDTEKNNCSLVSISLDRNSFKLESKLIQDFPESLNSYLLTLRKKGAAKLEYGINTIVRFGSSTFILLHLCDFDISYYNFGSLFLMLDSKNNISQTNYLYQPKYSLSRENTRIPVYKTNQGYSFPFDIDLGERKDMVKRSSEIFSKCSLEPDDNLVFVSVSEKGINQIKSFNLDKRNHILVQNNNFTRSGMPILVDFLYSDFPNNFKIRVLDLK